MTQTVNRVHESDIIAHIEDTRLFWVFRHGQQMKLTWNELTATEKQHQREADVRATYVQTFDIY